MLKCSFKKVTTWCLESFKNHFWMIHCVALFLLFATLRFFVFVLIFSFQKSGFHKIWIIQVWISFFFLKTTRWKDLLLILGQIFKNVFLQITDDNFNLAFEVFWNQAINRTLRRHFLRRKYRASATFQCTNFFKRKKAF